MSSFLYFLYVGEVDHSADKHIPPDLYQNYISYPMRFNTPYEVEYFKLTNEYRNYHNLSRLELAILLSRISYLEVAQKTAGKDFQKSLVESLVNGWIKSNPYREALIRNITHVGISNLTSGNQVYGTQLIIRIIPPKFNNES
jgi:uncharacterized protein YkwD